jgi:DNA mismatch repair ATPase MutS
MKVHLLHPDRDTTRELPKSRLLEDLVRDLGLETLFGAMAAGDPFLHDVARTELLQPLTDPDAIRYRQQVLSDCLQHPDVVRRLYQIATDAEASPRSVRGWSLSNYPSGILNHAVGVLEELIDYLRQLRAATDEHAAVFGSPGFQGFFATVRRNLDLDYFARLDDHLKRLHFRGGLYLTARLDDQAQSTDLVLRKPAKDRPSLLDTLQLPRRGEYTYRLPERDEAGARALSDLRDRPLNPVADAAAQSADHVVAFFSALRWEVGFYVGCLNIADELARRHLPVCLPEPEPSEAAVLRAEGLYDVGLGLRLQEGVVGNSVDADGCTLVMLTGTNQGGKSTMLRALGCAQLMMQAGLVVPAGGYRASVAEVVWTHFKREEDETLESGKLDEELERLSRVVDAIEPHGMVLFNESFSSTNEREGSRIARQVIDALREADVRLLFVTHMYDLAHGFAASDRTDQLFLRPERTADGTRTFRVVPGEPQTTSHGRDVFDRVFAQA